MFEAADLPLRGARVLVTRARPQSGPLSDRLRELGATVVELPLIRFAPVQDPASLDLALRRLDTYDWVIFTSANGVAAALKRLAITGLSASHLGSCRIGAIGPATAQAIREAGLRVDLVPARFLTTAILDAFRQLGVAGQAFLLPRADLASPDLAEGLRALGARVDNVVAYRTLPAKEIRMKLMGQLARAEIDVMTLASSSTVGSLVEALDGKLDLLRGVALVCIGPVTAEAARRSGLSVDAVAAEHSLDGLVHALARLWSGGNLASTQPEPVR